MKTDSLLLALYIGAALAMPVSAVAGGPAPVGSLRDSLSVFVRQSYRHGVPYAEAHALGPSALPILTTLLASEDYKRYWGNIAVTISFIREPAGFEILRAFVEDQFRGEVDIETFQALAAAQAVMGPLAGVSPQAMEYLMRGANPAYWQKLSWTFKNYRGDARGLLMSRLSIMALGQTGAERATRFLVELKRAPYSPRQQDALADAIELAVKIRDRGLEKYLTEHADRRQH